MTSRFHLLPADQFTADAPAYGEKTIPALNAYFKKQFGKSHSLFLNSGRDAMTVLFQHLKLKKEDEIFITTTFDYPNVSSCVTSTVFNHCKPSRVITNNTKGIFVIHEFGVVHPEMQNLRTMADERKIPLIEDCAHTFLSKGKDGKAIGTTGDWVIMSFPKFYPVRSGGMLLGNEAFAERMTADATKNDAAAIIERELPRTAEHAKKRIELSGQLIKGVSNKNMRPLLSENDSSSVPWFFPVEIKEPKKYLNKLNAAGIETGLWHGSNVIVLPLHQYFSDGDISEMVAIINNVSNEIHS